MIKTDLVILDDTDEELQFHRINNEVFQIYARYKGHALFIQPTMKDAKEIRDWLDRLLKDLGH